MRIALRHLGQAVNQSDLYNIVRIVLPGRATSGLWQTKKTRGRSIENSWRLHNAQV